MAVRAGRGSPRAGPCTGPPTARVWWWRRALLLTLTVAVILMHHFVVGLEPLTPHAADQASATPPSAEMHPEPLDAPTPMVAALREAAPAPTSPPTALFGTPAGHGGHGGHGDGMAMMLHLCLAVLAGLLALAGFAAALRRRHESAARPLGAGALASANGSPPRPVPRRLAQLQILRL